MILNYTLKGIYRTPKKLRIEFDLYFNRLNADNQVRLEERLPADHDGSSVGYHDNVGLYIMIYRDSQGWCSEE